MIGLSMKNSEHTEKHIRIPRTNFPEQRTRAMKNVCDMPSNVLHIALLKLNLVLLSTEPSW